MEVTPAMHPTANIKVVGLGGGGGNAINRMIKARLASVEFIAINTDAQALHYNEASTKIHIGKETTRGLGAGGNPDVGKKAVEENIDDVKKALGGADMVFLTTGLGGGTGSFSVASVADIVKNEIGALTIAVVTKPFSFEGAKRMKVAEEAHAALKDKVDALIVIPNDKLLTMVDKKTSLLDAFSVADEVLLQGISGISDIIQQHGIINVDFADCKSIMSNSGTALMGIGYGTGESRAVDAARSAMDSPLLDMSIDGAKGVLLNITGGNDLSMWEVDEAAKAVREAVDPECNVIFGATIDENMSGEIKVTLIATGFDREVSEASSSLRMGNSLLGSNRATRPATNFFGSDAFPKSPMSSGPSTATMTPPAKPAVATDTSSATAPSPAKEASAQPAEPADEYEVPAFIRKRVV